jgi:hypothetical protein
MLPQIAHQFTRYAMSSHQYEANVAERALQRGQYLFIIMFEINRRDGER